MAAQNKVTLTIAGDASGLDRAAMQARTAMVQTGESAQNLEHQLEQTGRAARGTKELLNGASSASMLLGGELGNTATQAGYAIVAMKDLSKGSAALIKNVGLLKVGLVALAVATAAVGVEATKSETGWANLGQDAWKPAAAQLSILDSVVQKMPAHLGFLGNALDDATNHARVHAGMSKTDRVAMMDEAAAADAAAKALANLARTQRANGTYGIADQNPGGDAFVDQNALDNMELDPAKLKAQYAGTTSAVRSGGGSVAKALTDTAAQAKAAAQALKDAQKTVADAVKSMADSFKPTLDMTGATGGYSRVGDTNGGAGGGLIANLKKQAKDTLRLRQDLEKLAKMGLDKGLLSNLVQGGLASLPAAEELLQGGKSEIGQANYYAGRINVRGNTIATEETARNLTKSDKQTLHIKVDGGPAEMVKLIQKWVKNNGGNVQAVLGS